MIQIGRPQIININNKARLEASIDIDGNKKVIWFEVDEKYGKYLCFERTRCICYWYIKLCNAT